MPQLQPSKDMDGNTMATIGSALVAGVALVRTFGREKAEEQDQRIREVIKLEVGDTLTLLKSDVKRILRKLDVNGDE